MKSTFFTTSQIYWFTFVALYLRVFKAFNCEATIMPSVGALHGRVFIKARFGITVLFLFILRRLFILLSTELASPKLLSFDLLVYEIFFIFLDFLSSDGMGALLASV